MVRDSAISRPKSLQSVAVCVCTYRRPEMVGSLLGRLRDEANRISGRAHVGVIVVDDDPEKSAEVVVRRAPAGFDLGVHYVHAGSRNIAIARNRAIKSGVEIAGTVALIDDDCVPGEGWLAELLTVYALGGAEIVTGVCLDRFPEATPAWVHRGPYFDLPMDEPDGAIVTSGYIKNILISSAAIRGAGIQFDPEFGRTGGEDSMFLIQARRSGFRNRRAARALVYERVPANRLTLNYQLWRRYWYGNTESLTSVASGHATRLRALFRGVRMIARSLLLVPVRLARRQPAEIHSAVAIFLQGLGRVLGAAGISVNHR